MNSNYNILFNLEIRHSYYKDNICRGLLYAPSNETYKIMSLYGFKIINNQFGFSFLFRNKSTLKNYLDYLKKATDINTFEFNITANNKALYQFTSQIPLTKIGVIQYSSDRVSKNNNEFVLQEKFIEQKTTKYVAQIQIHFSDIIQHTSNNKSIKFSINLNSRATQWQYNVVNISKQNYNSLAIRSNSIIAFLKTKTITLPNGQIAECFSSGENKIPLKEIPEYKFNLIGKVQKLGKTRKKIIFDSLPYPAPGSLLIHNNSKDVTSLAYVYI